MSAIVNRLHVKDSQRMLRSSVLGPSTLCTGHRFVRPAWVLVHRAPSIKFERTPPPIMEVDHPLEDYFPFTKRGGQLHFHCLFGG